MSTFADPRVDLSTRDDLAVTVVLDQVAFHVNAFRARATHAFVFRGQRTLAGELGAHRARLLTETGSLHLWTGAAV